MLDYYKIIFKISYVYARASASMAARPLNLISEAGEPSILQI